MISLLNNRVWLPFLAKKNAKAENIAVSPADNKRKLSNIYHKHHRQIFSLCYRATKNNEVAESITIKVFVQFYKELNDLKPNADLAAHLRRLAVTNLLHYFSNRLNHKARADQ